MFSNFNNYDTKVIINYIISILLIVLSFIFPHFIFSEQMKCIGFFSLSGSFTNWLAIKMLFKKIPYLYGSGVIIYEFRDIKKNKLRVDLDLIARLKRIH